MALNLPNVPQVGNINDFRSVLGEHNDVAKASNFAVQISQIPIMPIDPNILRSMMFLCESAELPGRGFNADEARYYGPSFKLPSQVVYQDVQLTFFVRNNMFEREFFDAWLNAINPKSTYDFNYRDEYATQIHIWQFTEVAKQVTTSDGTAGGSDSAGETGSSSTSLKRDARYRATLEKAYPVNVAQLPVNWAEDNFHRLQVTFTYTHWRTYAEQNAPSISPVLFNNGLVASTSTSIDPLKVR